MPEKYLGPLKSARQAQHWISVFLAASAADKDKKQYWIDAANLLSKGWQSVAAKPELAKRMETEVKNWEKKLKNEDWSWSFLESAPLDDRIDDFLKLKRD